jgi:hypothetical protein
MTGLFCLIFKKRCQYQNCSGDDRKFNEYGAFCEMRCGRGKPEYSGGNLPQRHFVHHKSHMT